MRFVVAIVALLGSTHVFAALTSAPIYAPCQANFVRTDLNICTRNEVNPSFINFPLNTCITVTIPKSRKIKLVISHQFDSANAVGVRQLNLYGYAGSGCINPLHSSAIGIYEQVATSAQVLLYHEKNIVINSPNGTYSFRAVNADTGNKIVWYIVDEYTDR